jgi:methylated-DNA-[protein]-cysteine S-methyltransferase
VRLVVSCPKSASAARRHRYTFRMIQYALFDTAIGWAGIAWGDKGLVGVHIPEHDPAITSRGLQRRFPDATEGRIPIGLTSTVQGICALMSGEKADLSEVPLDSSRVPDFNAKVYEIARAIPPGETLTYGQSCLPAMWVQHWARIPGRSSSRVIG